MADAITIQDSTGTAAATIAPGLGFNCIQFSGRVGDAMIEVIDSPADVLTTEHRPSSFGIPILFPFPNRIRAGSYQWDEKEYSVPLAPGRPNAIHGFCYDRPWRVIEQTEDSVTGQFQLTVDDPGRAASWPTDFILDLRYRVTECRLEAQFRIQNPTARPLPWGLGTHPYFRIPLGAESTPEDCLYSVDAHEEWELEDALPTGLRRPLETRESRPIDVRFGSRKYDNVFSGWDTDGEIVRTSVIDEKQGIEITQVCDGRLFSEAVVFTPPNRNAVCLEPYTCVTDAMNLHDKDVETGLQILDAGEEVQTWIAIQVSPVVA